MKNKPANKMPYYKSPKSHFLHASLFLFMLAAPLATQQLLAFDSSADQAISRAIANGAFGPVKPEGSKGELELKVNGESVEPDGRIHLVPAGDKATLSASLRKVGNAVTAEPQSGGIQQVSHTQVVWTGADDDTFTPGPDGSVSWIPGGENSGRASKLLVSAARLEGSLPVQTLEPADAVPVPVHIARGEVMLLPGVPLDRAGDGMLFGQNIGIYPNEASDKAPASVRDRVELYRPPSSFYRLDEETGPAKVTKHFTLRDLNPPVFPEEESDARFIALSPRLITFMQSFEKNLKERGFSPENIIVLRGYVTPTERQRLERFGEPIASFSRFQYGDAIAFVYDDREAGSRQAPRMSDLDGDGSATIADADLLATIAKDTMDELQMFGGLGVGSRFGGTTPAADTPYVHVDLRGFYSPFREE